MAPPFAFDPLDEEDEDKVVSSGAAPAFTGGGESFGAGSTQTPQPEQQKGTAKQGSGFVNLDKYMTANQGSDFGNQFTGKVQGEVDAGKQKLAEGAAAFNTASNQGTTNWNDVNEWVYGTVDSAGDKTSAEDVARLKGYSGAKYAGPDSFLSTVQGSAAQGGVQKASQSAKALQSEGGRFALLDQYFGKPKYNMGEKSLDNFLVQNDRGVNARTQSIGRQANQLSNEGYNTARDLDNLAASNKVKTQDVAQNTINYLNQSKNTFDSDLERRYQEYLASNAAANSDYSGDISDDALTDSTMAAMGLSDGQSLWDLDLSNYLQHNDNGSLGQFASDADYARYLALNQLAGTDPQLLRSEGRGEAGKGAMMGRLGTDRSRLAEDLASRESSWRSSMDEQEAKLSEIEKVLAGLNQEVAPANSTNVNTTSAPSQRQDIGQKTIWDQILDFFSGGGVTDQPDQQPGGDSINNFPTQDPVTGPAPDPLPVKDSVISDYEEQKAAIEAEIAALNEQKNRRKVSRA